MDTKSFKKLPSSLDTTCPLSTSFLGDAAIGEGVNRHVLSVVMYHLQNGFLLDDENGTVVLCVVLSWQLCYGDCSVKTCLFKY